jgi:prevent-host-death family protein
MVSMATVTVTELKARLSEKLRDVQRGEELLVTDHGRVIARILPARDLDAEAVALARAGVLRLPEKSMTLEFLEQLEVPEDPKGLLASALEEERQEGW